MKGIFSLSQLQMVKGPPSIIPRCGECGLYKKCHSPKMTVYGNGKKGILICGEAPGLTEDQQGRPFVGKSGQLLQDTLSRIGISLREDCWVTNSARCRPPSNQLDDKVISYCRPYLLNFIREKQEEIKVVILLGFSAVKSLIGHIWKEDVGIMGRWAGWQIPYQKGNYYICPTFHPSYILREKNNPLPKMFFEKHIEKACALSEKPWNPVPDYRSQVECVFDPDKAAKIIRKMIRLKGICSFDYETNMLKPDSKKAEIICNSICWQGEKTIAYPWTGEAILATREFLESGLEKISFNQKFEIRWSVAKLGVCPKNIIHDGMLAAHVLDNRPQITSLEFQEFVLLGVTDHKHTIKHYLQSKEAGANSENRIREVDLRTLLLYCGQDSLIEYLVAQKQMEKLECI